jgi:hypothetical protein
MRVCGCFWPSRPHRAHTSKAKGARKRPISLDCPPVQSTSTCPYTSVVSEARECPAAAATSVTGTPCLIHRLIRRCRRSCGLLCTIPACLHALDITACALAGLNPPNTRRSAVRSSRGQVAATSAISQAGTATQRLAAAVLPFLIRNLAPCSSTSWRCPGPRLALSALAVRPKQITLDDQHATPAPSAPVGGPGGPTQLRGEKGCPTGRVV